MLTIQNFWTDSHETKYYLMEAKKEKKTSAKKKLADAVGFDNIFNTD
jgi:hypothetical protein